MSAPNQEGSANPAVLAGGQFGAIVGNSDGPIGFFGSPGTTIVAGSTLTSVALIVAYLQALGLAS